MGRYANAFGPERPEATYVAHSHREQLVGLGEVQMNYATAGEPSKPALLLVPGLHFAEHPEDRRERRTQVMADRRQQRGTQPIALLELGDGRHLGFQPDAFQRQGCLIEQAEKQRQLIGTDRRAGVGPRDAEYPQDMPPGRERMEKPFRCRQRLGTSSGRLVVIECPT